MRLDHQRAPLFEAILEYQQQVKGNFHVPGHKQGNVFDQDGKKYFSSLLSLDLTEVAFLDDLHDPHGVIAEAQQLAADAFGADHTIFLVGGTTAGNLATFLSLCQPGDQVIIQRSSHLSLFHGCLLAGGKPIYISAGVDQDTGFEKPIDPIWLDQILTQEPQVKGVWITSPSYYGINQPLKELAEVCHAHQIPFIVDEAHGAHYTFHEDLPLSAMQSGADVSVQSTHKTLSSMTMSSMLHIQGNRVHRAELENWLRVIESSSPSYPLMASLDLARRDMVCQGSRRLAFVWGKLLSLRKKIESLTHLTELVYDQQQDPFRMSLMLPGVSGFHLSKQLQEEGIFSEFADLHKVLLIFSVGTTEEECTHLWEVLQKIESLSMDKNPSRFLSSLSSEKSISKSLFTLREIRYQRKKRIPLHQATGQVAAQMITPYPPGIPIILPGEEVTPMKINQLNQWIDQGIRMRGIKETERWIDVLE